MSKQDVLAMQAGAEGKAEAFRNRSRAAFVYESLREAIWDGKLQCGERIREEEIAHSLGVSRTPVREALRRLQSRGLLEMLSGRGLVVATLSKQQILELYDMREILEGSAARFAAQHASETEIASLQVLRGYFVEAQDRPSRMREINLTFHNAIYEAAHNRYLIEALNQLHDALALLQGTTFEEPGRPEVADEEHRKIIAAIEGRDPEAAEAAAREHIRRARHTRLEMLVRAES